MLHELITIWFGWVENWGYTGVFFLMAMESSIIPVPSEVVIPPAAFWAAQGKMDFTGVILAGTLGSYFGSAVSYWVSQWVGLPILRRYGKYVLLPPDKLELAERWVQRFGVTGIFIARLLPVVRHLISIPAGILKMPFWSFSLATTIGAGLWCWVLAIFGREVIGGNPELMQSPEAMVAVLKAKLHWFVLAVVALGLLYGFIIWFKNQNQSRVNAGKLLALFFFTSLLGTTFVSTGCGTATKKPVSENRVILISIDGLTPADYLSPSSPALNLRALAQKGAHAEAVLPAYPSVTFPNHASLATGVRPAKHGILSNTIFNPEKGPTQDWYFDSRALQVPTLWEGATRQGLTTALIAWPVSLNAKVNWLVPEVFSPDGIDHDKNWQHTLKNTDPALMNELILHSSVKHIKNNADYDQWMTEAALHILETHQPSLTLLHYRSLDAAQHEHGRVAPEVKEALRFVDTQIGRLIAANDLEHTAILVVGDHGFVDVTQELRLNALFRAKGWLTARGKTISAWKVIAHSNGGQATVYLHGSMMKNLEFRTKVENLLKKNAGGRYRIIDRAELNEKEALPEAFCALDSLNGYGFSQSSEGKFITQLKGTKGEHGALADNPLLWTGFLAAGAGISSGVNLGKISILDIAPTAAKLLNAALPTAEGNALNLTP